MERKFGFTNIFKRAGLTAVVFLFLAPVLFTFVNSFTQPGGGFTFVNYGMLLFGRSIYLKMFWNSVILVVPVLIGQFFIAPLAAYGLENIRFRGKEVLYFIYIIIMLMPMQLLLVPNFIVAGWLGIRGSYLAIILPALFHPLGVFLIRQQLKSFPRECQEAAQIDGATAFQTYLYIIRPNMSSTVAVMMVLLFADNWNIIDQAAVFITDLSRMPLSIVLGSLTEDSSGMLSAVSFFYIIPPLLVYLLSQGHLRRGIVLVRNIH